MKEIVPEGVLRQGPDINKGWAINSSIERQACMHPPIAPQSHSISGAYTMHSKLSKLSPISIFSFPMGR